MKTPFRCLPLTLLLVLPLSIASGADPVLFVRGDANADGSLSTADALTIQRWLFGGDPAPSCIDSADVDDDGRVNICDAIGIFVYLFSAGGCGNNGVPVDFGDAPPAPFPAAGDDPTADEAPYMSCEGFTITPPEQTEDTIRIGDVEAAGGGQVEIPVYVSNARPIEAIQLVLSHDTRYVRIQSEPGVISYVGTYFEQFLGKAFPTEGGFFTYGEPFTFTSSYQEDGFFTLSIVPDILGRGNFSVPTEGETLVAKIRAEVSPDAPPGTLVRLDPADGPLGEGYGSFHLRNELTYEGTGRYPTIAPRTLGGILRIGVDGDISFFVRGDANGDGKVDISDPVYTLAFLFLGAEDPACPDAMDADDDGSIIITDAIAVLSGLFLGTDSISAPYPSSGRDEHPDFLAPCQPRS